MQGKTIKEIEQEYELEIDRIVKEIRKQKAKIVLLQFPDGMKQHATAIVQELEKKLPKKSFLIWLGSCFGACDVPQISHANEIPAIDLIVQFGHSAWNYDKKSGIKAVW